MGHWNDLASIFGKLDGRSPLHFGDNSISSHITACPKGKNDHSLRYHAFYPRPRALNHCEHRKKHINNRLLLRRKTHGELIKGRAESRLGGSTIFQLRSRCPELNQGRDSAHEPRTSLYSELLPRKSTSVQGISEPGKCHGRKYGCYRPDYDT